MKVNEELENVWVLFKALSEELPGGTEEKCKILSFVN